MRSKFAPDNGNSATTPRSCALSLPRDKRSSTATWRPPRADGVVDGLEGNTLNSGAKASARSRFESTKQRFFGQVLLSMKLPTVIAAAEQHLAEGKSVVMQLVTTAESILDRRLGHLARMSAPNSIST
jgi:hypothetical protein